MNPTMDMDRYQQLGPNQCQAVDTWVADQFASCSITRVDATREGEVAVNRLPNRLVWFDTYCPNCGIRIDSGILGRRQHVPVTTPPPWTHPDWTDL